MPAVIAKIINKRGLHARAAAKFATTAAKFQCDIQACNPDKENWVDGKSVMSLMLLAASQGCELKISAEGDDGEQALAALCALIADRFDEGE